MVPANVKSSSVRIAPVKSPESFHPYSDSEGVTLCVPTVRVAAQTSVWAMAVGGGGGEQGGEGDEEDGKGA